VGREEREEERKKKKRAAAQWAYSGFAYCKPAELQ
jgi:hypothetical protein